MIHVITGATGLIGRQWLERLLSSHPEATFVAIARNPGSVMRHERVRAVRGDLASPDAIEVDGDIRAIYHAAADIRFGLPLEAARAVNAGGTARMIELARRSRNFEKFIHVSTAFVAGNRAGEIAERAVDPEPGFFNAYQRTKYEAEMLVLAARDVPAMIVRPSTVIGDSTGRVEQRNYFHQLLRLIPRNPLACIPADPSARVDLIPSDWAVETLHRITEHEFRAGSIRHICAGAEGAQYFGELFERAYQLYGRPIRKPALVPQAEYAGYVKGLRAGERELARVLDYFVPHLSIHQTFRTSVPPPPHIGTYYDGIVRSVFDGA